MASAVTSARRRRAARGAARAALRTFTHTLLLERLGDLPHEELDDLAALSLRGVVSERLGGACGGLEGAQGTRLSLHLSTNEQRFAERAEKRTTWQNVLRAITFDFVPVFERADEAAPTESLAQSGDPRVGSPIMSPLAAFSVLDITASERFGLAPRVGRATKHPANPLWGQDQPWELRIDNGYADVFHNASEPLGAWRMYYTSFTECNDQSKDSAGRYTNCGSGRRWYQALYATSDDGVSWRKPVLNTTCYLPGQHDHNTSCARAGSLRTNAIYDGTVDIGMFYDAQEHSIA
jgi:hypothetical protein